MNKTAVTLLLIGLFAGPTHAQLSITKVEKLPLSSSKEWDAPQFSPDGKRVYFTTADLNGIWEYSIDRRTTRQITADQKCGYGFTFSPDGKKIAYRRTTINKRTHRRTQEIILRNLVDGKASVQASGADLSLPTFTQSNMVYSVGKQVKNLPTVSQAGSVSVLGIEGTKIVLLQNGNRVLFDPLGNGSYIWPSLSPDRTQLLAYEMARGAFVCDLHGTVTSRLGKRDAPVWTRDGKWIVFMEDRDDGQQVLSSDLFCISPDGTRSAQLTDTKDVMEMHPQCSPTENKIVCSTMGGEIYVLSYEEVGQ